MKGWNLMLCSLIGGFAAAALCIATLRWEADAAELPDAWYAELSVHECKAIGRLAHDLRRVVYNCKDGYRVEGER